jgi:hypothetical protein
MPGQIKQLTSDELAKLEIFPLPVSGKVVLVSVGGDQYILDCTDVSGADSKRLEDFHERMKGGLYTFRFESKTHHFPHCHFGNSSVTFFCNAPNRCGVQLPIEVQHTKPR